MKCEACGHETGRKYNPTKRIISLLEERGSNTICQRKLKRVIKLIRENINSDKNNQKMFIPYNSSTKKIKIQVYKI